jgi:hypothetical protein
MKASGVILFHTSSAAMRAEKTLLRAGFCVKLVPTPRELSSDCGIALAFPGSDSEQVKSALNAARVETAGIHVLQGG